MLAASDSLSADVEHLSPRVRELPLDQAIPTISLESIRDFLTTPRLVDADELRAAPYVLSFVDPHIVEGTGSLVYLQKMPKTGAQCWDMIRSEEHTTELQSLMRSSYAGFCLKTKKQTHST